MIASDDMGRPYYKPRCIAPWIVYVHVGKGECGAKGEQGPTEPHTGCSTFLLSSGCAKGGYY